MYVCVCIYACMYVCICMNIIMYVEIMCKCVYIYIYILTFPMLEFFATAYLTHNIATDCDRIVTVL